MSVGDWVAIGAFTVEVFIIGIPLWILFRATSEVEGDGDDIFY